MDARQLGSEADDHRQPDDVLRKYGLDTADSASELWQRLDALLPEQKEEVLRVHPEFKGLLWFGIPPASFDIGPGGLQATCHKLRLLRAEADHVALSSGRVVVAENGALIDSKEALRRRRSWWYRQYRRLTTWWYDSGKPQLLRFLLEPPRPPNKQV